MSARSKFFVYLLTFQALWLACVLYGAVAHGWPLLLIALGLTYVHLQLSEGWQAALPLLLTVLLGMVADQMVYHFGWITFTAQASSAPFIPLWMVALWLGFSSSLNENFSWLRAKPLLAILFGAIGGPVAYLGAEKLGAVVLTMPFYSSVWIAMSWGILMPLMLWLRSPTMYVKELS